MLTSLKMYSDEWEGHIGLRTCHRLGHQAIRLFWKSRIFAREEFDRKVYYQIYKTPRNRILAVLKERQ